MKPLSTARPKPKRENAAARKRSRIKSRNHKRMKRLREEQFGGAYRDYIVSLPCDICGDPNHSEPAHLKSRGSGGKACDLAPLCGPQGIFAGCHRIYDEHCWTLPHGTEERLKTIAAQRWQDFNKEVSEK